MMKIFKLHVEIDFVTTKNVIIIVKRERLEERNVGL
jgi:hypothetical protein